MVLVSYYPGGNLWVFGRHAGWWDVPGGNKNGLINPPGGFSSSLKTNGGREDKPPELVPGRRVYVQTQIRLGGKSPKR